MLVVNDVWSPAVALNIYRQEKKKSTNPQWGNEFSAFFPIAHVNTDRGAAEGEGSE